MSLLIFIQLDEILSNSEELSTYVAEAIVKLQQKNIPLIIIPNSQGVPAGFKDRDWQIASQTGLEGWIEAIAQLNL